MFVHFLEFLKHWGWLIFAVQIFIMPGCGLSDASERLPHIRSLGCLSSLLYLVPFVAAMWMFWERGWRSGILFSFLIFVFTSAVNVIAVSFIPRRLNTVESYLVLCFVACPIINVIGLLIFCAI